MILPYIRFYVRDWMSDQELRMCSLEARGFWFECLCLMHNAARRGFLESPSGIPYTDDDIARLIGTFKGDVYRCKEELMKHNVPSVDDETGVWYCRRMVKEKVKADKCAAAGKRGGGSPLIKDSIKNTRYHISLKVTFKGQEYPNVFEAFWKLYPRKASKKVAEKKFWQMVPQFPDDPQELFEIVEKHAASEQWQKDGGQFIPYPATWLNQERWKDEIQSNSKKSNQPPPMRDLRDIR